MMKKMKDLHVTIVQPDIIWKSAAENLSKYSQMLSELKDSTDLILLPEMFQTGFCMEQDLLAETMDGETVRWMKRIAELYNCAIAGSLIIRENRRFFNRIIFIDQYENFTWYDKRHLFQMAGENKKFTAGLERLIVPLNGWQISFQICYDLRFPVWSRYQDDYDVLVNVANWPAVRSDVWDTLLKARAIENQSYVLGVNRVGTDGNGIAYTGDSKIIDPKGETLVALQSSKEDMKTATLSWDKINDFRAKFPVWKDRDEFQWQ